MKLTPLPCKLSLLALAIIAGPFAVAQDAGWYVGASLGPTRANVDETRVGNELLIQGLTLSGIASDERSNGYKVFGGYRLNRNFSLEGGYFDLGKFGFQASTLPLGTLNGTIAVRGVNLDLVGTIPVTNRLSLLGRIGANYAEAQDNFSATGAVAVLNPSPSKRDTNLKVGLGLQYAFTDALMLRGELERYRIDDAVGNKGDIDHLSIGLVYQFGVNPPAAPVARAPAPAPYVAPPPPVMVTTIVPPPPPPPVPVAAPPAPRMPVKVAFSAESLFGFDQAVVLPEGKRQLDKFAADLRGVTFDTVIVTGHTDRIGAHDYNMRLSTRRADAVKAYLVETDAIAPDRISDKGVGGSEPVTKPGECLNKKVSKALIACLQPDRRVEIEVTGTR